LQAQILEQQQAGDTLVVLGAAEQLDNGRAGFSFGSTAYSGEITGQTAVVVSHPVTQGTLQGAAGQQMIVLAEMRLFVLPLHAELVLRQQGGRLLVRVERTFTTADAPSGLSLQGQLDLQCG